MDKYIVTKGNSLSHGKIMVSEGQELKKDFLSLLPKDRLNELVKSGVLIRSKEKKDSPIFDSSEKKDSPIFDSSEKKDSPIFDSSSEEKETKKKKR